METSRGAIVRGSHRRENHGLRISLKGRECIIHEKPHPKSDFFAHKSGTSRTILNGKSKLPALSSDFFAGSSVVSR